MAQARSGSRVESKINMLAYGASFCGKSTLGLQMSLLKNPDGSPFKVLVLDCENGSVDCYIEQFEEQGVKPENIYIVYSQSLEEINHYIELVTKHEDLHVLDDDGEETDEIVLDADGKPFRADCILLDGSSILNLTCQQSLLNLSRKRAKVRANRNNLIGDERAVAIDGASLELKDWNTLKYSGQSLVLNLAASGVHWVITAREKAETERIKNGKGEIETINTGKFIPEGFGSVDYNCKTVVRMFRTDDEPDVVKMEVLKDRTGIFAPGQIVEDPSILVFQKMIDKKGVSKFTIKNTMEQAIEAETKMYQRSLGIDDEDVDESNPQEINSENTPMAADDIIAQIKTLTAPLYPDKKKEIGNKLKAAELPTSYTKLKDVNTLNKILKVVKDVIG